MFRHLLVLFAFLLSSSFASYFNTTIYTYKTVDGLPIEAVTYYPNYPSSEKYPVLLGFHSGGGFTTGSKMGAFSIRELWEGLYRGWVVVAIDYRLSPGALLDDIIQDMQDAYNWIRTDLANRIPINPDLITVFGGSSGGSLALLAGYKLTPRPKAIISFYPYCANFTDPFSYKPETPVSKALVAAANNLSQEISQYQTSGPADPRLLLFYAAITDGKGGWLLSTHDPDYPTDKIMEKLRGFSATENVDKDFPPTYLVHGLNDRLVPYSQSVQMSEVLKAKNIPYVLDLVPSADHGFDLGNDVTPDMWEKHIAPAFEFAQKFMNVTMKRSNVKSEAQKMTRFLSK